MAVIPAGKWSIETVTGAPGEPARVTAYSSHWPQSFLTDAGFDAVLRVLADVATADTRITLSKDAAQVVVPASAARPVVDKLVDVLGRPENVT